MGRMEGRQAVAGDPLDCRQWPSDRSINQAALPQNCRRAAWVAARSADLHAYHRQPKRHGFRPLCLEGFCLQGLQHVSVCKSAQLLVHVVAVPRESHASRKPAALSYRSGNALHLRVFGFVNGKPLLHHGLRRTCSWVILGRDASTSIIHRASLWTYADLFGPWSSAILGPSPNASPHITKQMESPCASTFPSAPHRVLPYRLSAERSFELTNARRRDFGVIHAVRRRLTARIIPEEGCGTCLSQAVRSVACRDQTVALCRCGAKGSHTRWRDAARILWLGRHD